MSAGILELRAVVKKGREYGIGGSERVPGAWRGIRGGFDRMQDPGDDYVE